MRPLPLVAGVGLAGFLLIRRHRLGRLGLGVGAVVVLGCMLVGTGVVEPPDLEKLIEDTAVALGPYTYVLVGALAFLETGAFVGLVAPGETAVLVGGVVAGQGQIDPIALFAIVWTCAVAGDVTSYFLGRRLGRGFMLRHGPKFKITEDRLHQVEEFFDRRGGVTILIGRFIGLVRALAPFIAGTSRMPLSKFLPYDILGAGLWAALFITLGYVFSRSLGTVTTYVGRGLFLFGAIVVVVVVGVYIRRLVHHPAERRRAQAWIDEQAARPYVAPVARRLEPVWLRALRPAGRRAMRPARFLYERLTPGGLGLELTTLLAVAAVGAFAFLALAEALDEARTVLPGDRRAASLSRTLASSFVQDLVSVFTDLGSLVVTGVLTAATALWAAGRRRFIEGGALVAGLTLTWLAVHVAKATEDRPRPAGGLVDTLGQSYPSGHAAYAVALVACAVVLVRAGSNLALGSAAVTVAILLAVAIAVSRIYLRVHYLSDVVGGLALGAAIFALCAIVGLVVAFVRHNPAS